MEDIMPAKRWLKILNWKKLPAFGDIHNLEEAVFQNIYYSDHHKIQHMTACLLSGLKGEFPSNNSRIIGFPGVGKTTFLYFLKSILKKEKTTNKSIKSFLKIIDCVEVIVDDTVDKDLLAQVLYNATKDYFSYFPEVWENQVVKNIIQNSEHTLSEKNRHLWNFFHDNLIMFPQRLFLALDGIDTVPENCMVPLSVAIHNALPHKYVRLWLSIRDVRYESLTEKTRMRLNTLFQEPHSFPHVELSGIIEERIRNIETKPDMGKNPFSEQLCSFLMNFYNGDLRCSLSMMLRILQEVAPKGIEHKTATDINFIQKYIDREAIFVLFTTGEICNLFDVAQGAFRSFPLEKEVLMALSAHPRIDNILRSVLKEEIETKLSVVKLKFPIDAVLSETTLQTVLNFLKQRGLIEILGVDVVIITPRGWEMQKIAETEYYISNLCKTNTITRLGRGKVSEYYWKMAEIRSPYQELVLERMLKYDGEGYKKSV